MTYHDVYISNYEDGFDEPEGKLQTPYRRSPFFPGGYEHWKRFYNWGEEGRFKTIQTDWGASVAIVSKDELQAFFDACFVERLESWHLRKEKKQLKAWIKRCDPDAQYLLCATEL